MEAEIIHRFLESVGQKADVDLYLKLFRSQKKESFAIIAADAPIVRTALDPFHFDLRILAGLGLLPVVLVGLFDAKDADKQAQRIYEWLVEDQVPTRIIAAGPTLGPHHIEEVRATVMSNTIPVVTLEGAKDLTTDARFDLLKHLTCGLETRKVVFLSTSQGLEREGAPPISMVNLSLDYERLLSAKGQLSRRHGTLLRQVRDLLFEVPQRMSVAVVNPLALLRELFTISGAGTLVRKGARIETHRSFETLDRARLEGLIESGFGRPLREGVLEGDVERIYLEENYMGAALLAPSPIGDASYLTKFAVERAAQGEGIGGDVWSAMLRDYRAFFWRSRPSNAITPWYAKQADGLARFPEWHVFWKGLAPDQLATAIEFCLAHPNDFTVPTAP